MLYIRPVRSEKERRRYIILKSHRFPSKTFAGKLDSTRGINERVTHEMDGTLGFRLIMFLQCFGLFIVKQLYFSLILDKRN